MSTWWNFLQRWLCCVLELEFPHFQRRQSFCSLKLETLEASSWKGCFFWTQARLDVRRTWSCTKRWRRVLRVLTTERRSCCDSVQSDLCATCSCTTPERRRQTTGSSLTSCSALRTTTSATHCPATVGLSTAPSWHCETAQVSRSPDTTCSGLFACQLEITISRDHCCEMQIFCLSVLKLVSLMSYTYVLPKLHFCLHWVHTKHVFEEFADIERTTRHKKRSKFTRCVPDEQKPCARPSVLCNKTQT